MAGLADTCSTHGRVNHTAVALIQGMHSSGAQAQGSCWAAGCQHADQLSITVYYASDSGPRAERRMHYMAGMR